MGIHEGKIEEQKEEQKEKDDAIKERLDEHDDKLEGHKDDLGEHKVTLDEHDTKLKTYTHQLGLAKTAMDGAENEMTGLHFGNKRLKGTSADKLIDWDCELDADGKTRMTDVQDEDGHLLPVGPQRKSRAQEKADAAAEAQNASDRRRLTPVYASVRPSEHALGRRRLVVLEQLLGEITR